jgi:hypothetical protein
MWHESILEIIGNTPMVRLNRIGRGVKPILPGKLEYLNLCSIPSIRRRVTRSPEMEASLWSSSDLALHHRPSSNRFPRAPVGLGRPVFAFNRERFGKTYPQKRVEVLYVMEQDIAVTVTVYVFFGEWKDQQ